MLEQEERAGALPIPSSAPQAGLAALTLSGGFLLCVVKGFVGKVCSSWPSKKSAFLFDHWKAGFGKSVYLGKAGGLGGGKVRACADLGDSLCPCALPLRGQELGSGCSPGKAEGRHLSRAGHSVPRSLRRAALLEASAGARSALLTFPNMRRSHGRSQVSARLCRENLYHFCQIHHNALVLPYIFLNVTEYSAVIN